MVPPSDMQQNFIDFLLAGEGTDVVFHVGGETFAAHRCVLAARSTVFRAALFGPMKEGTSTDTTVQIEDMDAAVFKAMLGFIYSDSFPTLVLDENEGDLLQHLLVAADRYNLTRLQAMCERELCEHIEVGTATTILALAEQHDCNGLRKACYKFLQCPDNLRAVVDTDGFDQLCRGCPSLMKDMILSYEGGGRTSY
ncbi:hypothetical protein VPH35_133268 [Triticum aestivum]|uniref:BTB/POZ and MATH domain-containing protein 2-like n=1 Tax=Triticum aestivum TaxID=4565 RepID=UPI001D02D8F0|nr:BTB/POZ and MATH domain-containing protein 2-like [Triticum aestivum]